MKTNISILMAATLLMAGCSTLDNEARNWETTAEVVSYVGTVKAMESNPEWRNVFEHVSAELAALEEGDTDIITVLQIIQRLPIKELRSADAALYIEAGTILLADHFGSVELEKLRSQQPIVAAIRRGIERGLEFHK